MQLFSVEGFSAETRCTFTDKFLQLDLQYNVLSALILLLLLFFQQEHVHFVLVVGDRKISFLALL